MIQKKELFFDENGNSYFKNSYVKDDWNDILSIMFDNGENIIFNSDNYQLIMKLKNLENNYINSVSFMPNYGERETIYFKSYEANQELNDNNLDSLLLSKFANKPFAKTNKLIASHPNETILSELGNKFGIQNSLNTILNGHFCILNDREYPYTTSNGPNVIFIPNDIDKINFFCNNEQDTNDFFNELIIYINKNKEYIWDLYLKKLQNMIFS